MARHGQAQRARYPALAFFTVVIISLISSIVVITSLYLLFAHTARPEVHVSRIFRLSLHPQDVKSELEAPWGFPVLHAAAYVTLLFTISAVLLYFCHLLFPLLNLVLNCLALGVWIAGFCGVASYTAERKVLKLCYNVKDRACVTYKIAFFASILGLAVALIAVILDVYVYRHRADHRGFYEDLDANKGSKTSSDRHLKALSLPQHMEPMRGEKRDYTAESGLSKGGSYANASPIFDDTSYSRSNVRQNKNGSHSEG